MPSKRHGPSTFNETLEKIRDLKSRGVREWSLEDVALPQQRACAQQVQSRVRPRRGSSRRHLPAVTALPDQEHPSRLRDLRDLR